MTTTAPGHLATLHTTASGELPDGLAEALGLPPDPRTRSAVIFPVVQEPASTRELARAALDHRPRMAFFAHVWETGSR